MLPNYAVKIVLIYAPWKLKIFLPRRLGNNTVEGTFRKDVKIRKPFKQSTLCHYPGGTIRAVLAARHNCFFMYADRKLNWPTFPIKGQRGNILGFVGHMVSVATTQLCLCSIKVAIDKRWMNEPGCVSLKLHLRKRQPAGSGPQNVVCQSLL